MRSGFVAGLVFLFPAFIYQLAVNQATGDFVGSRILQAANLGCSAFAVLMITSSRQATDLLFKCRPLIVIVGLAFASAAWSYNTRATLQASVVLSSTTLFGVAMASRLSLTGCVRLIVRAMAFGCMLSLVWVLVFPDSAIHQLTDAYQTVHAGLWRGIFSHKQGLGVFSGLTSSFLLYYGSIAFPMLPVRIGALACSIACLVGTQSVTGMITAVFTTGMLYATRWIVRRPPPRRNAPAKILIFALLAAIVALKSGMLDFIPLFFGKSADLSGRADLWPYVLDRFKNSGSMLLGGGFGSDFAVAIAPGVSVDNGYIDKLVEFGYLGFAILISVYLWILIAGLRLVLKTATPIAELAIFPLNAMLAIMFVNVSESNFLSKNIGTVIVAVAVCQIVRLKSLLRSDGSFCEAPINVPQNRSRPPIRQGY